MECKEEGCSIDVYCRGYCSKHYYRLYKKGLLPKKKKRNRCCRVQGCSRKDIRYRGYCKRHYAQITQNGMVLERTRFDLNAIIDYSDYVGICLYNKQQEKIAEALADKCDVNALKKHKWYLSNGYAATHINNKVVTMHRVILPDNKMTDHKDRNPLNNRRSNLRECTSSQNNMNKRVKAPTTSGIAGVCWEKDRNKWSARLKINSRMINLGRFTNMEDAVKVRKEAEKKYFGEFAPTT